MNKKLNSRGIEGNQTLTSAHSQETCDGPQVAPPMKGIACVLLSDLNPDLKFYGVVGGMHEASPWNELSAMALRGANPCPTPTFYKEAEWRI
jgi:hypothetical protein